MEGRYHRSQSEDDVPPRRKASSLGELTKNVCKRYMGAAIGVEKEEIMKRRAVKLKEGSPHGKKMPTHSIHLRSWGGVVKRGMEFGKLSIKKGR